MNGSVLEEKLSLKMLGLTFPSKLDCGPYINSIAKTASKKLGALIRSMKFPSPEVVLYLYKSTMRPCRKKDTKSYKKGYAGLSVFHFLPLLNRWNVASQLRRCSSELAQLVPLPFSRGRSIRYSYRLHDFSAMIPRCYKNAYVNSFFCRRAELWDSLPIECFPLTYNLNGFMSRINIHLLTVGSFSRDFLYAFIFLCFFSL